MDIDSLSAKDKERLVTLLREKAFRKAHTVIDDFKPYDWQKEFLASSEGNALFLLMAGNRTGKPFTGAAAMSYHLTGLYPEWWDDPVGGLIQPLAQACNARGDDSVVTHERQ